MQPNRTRQTEALVFFLPLIHTCNAEELSCSGSRNAGSASCTGDIKNVPLSRSSAMG